MRPEESPVPDRLKACDPRRKDRAVVPVPPSGRWHLALVTEQWSTEGAHVEFIVRRNCVT